MNLQLIVGLAGGLGLFLFGMKLMSEAMRSLSLGILKQLLEKITANRIKATLVGTALTAIIQSSSATSVILIGFINAGLLSLHQALPVIFGANIGTTITAQLIAFKLTKSALVFIFIGAIVNLFAKKEKNKNRALAIIGFGILFLGLSVMSDAVKPLASNETVVELFIKLGRYPLLGVLTGLIVTSIIQSSSTTVGMVIAFATAGLLDLPSSIYLVMGDNIGTCITAILASLGGRIASKRLAVGHALFNVIGTMIFFPLIPLYIRLVPLLSSDIARQIANTHTIFNIFNTVILLPFVPLFVRILTRLAPGEDYEKRDTRYLDINLLATPDTAVRAVIKQLCVMVEICKEMLEKAQSCIGQYNHKLKNELTIDEDSIDEMQKDVTAYLVELTKCQLSDKRRRIIPALLHSVNDLERVGDYCDDIGQLAQRLYENNLTFSDSAAGELNKIFEKTQQIIKFTHKAMRNDDHDAARITLSIEREADELIVQYKLNHLRRLVEGTCMGDSGLVFSDILTYMGRLNDHLCNITKGILHIGKR
ncbi:MAG: Na/Pi cotransporter family protein [Deltaproteobacteria bacterium]|nr:Na/Pi cotransporter family protein [Deltaproteobacteria bacterium]